LQSLVWGAGASVVAQTLRTPATRGSLAADQLRDRAGILRLERSASDGGDNADGVLVLDRRLLAIQVTDVFVVDIDIHKIS